MIWKIGLIVIAVYGVLAFIARLFSEAIIFQPPAAGPEAAIDTFFVQTSGGTDIATLVTSELNSEQVILYSHGNAEDLAGIRSRIKLLASQLKVNVVAYDYPGYGASGGTASEDGAYQAIDAVYDYLISDLGYQPKQIVLYGRSVGGGPTCYLAAKHSVSAVIIESSFTSAFRVVTQVPLFPFDRFPNLKHIRTIEQPSLFFIGTRDFIIPSWHGRRLFAASPSPDKQLEVVKGAGHNNLPDVAGERYYEVLTQFLRPLRNQQK